MNLTLQILSAVFGSAGALVALFGDTWHKHSEKWWKHLTPIGWMATTFLFLACLAVTAQNVVASRDENAMRESEQKQLQKLVDGVERRLMSEIQVRDESLAEKQIEIDSLRLRIRELTEPELIFTKTLPLNSESPIQVEGLPLLRTNDVIDFTIRPAVFEKRHKRRTTFGLRIQTMTVSMAVPPTRIKLVAASRSYALEANESKFTVLSDSETLAVQYNVAFDEWIEKGFSLKESPHLVLAVKRKPEK